MFTLLYMILIIFFLVHSSKMLKRVIGKGYKISQEIFSFLFLFKVVFHNQMASNELPYFFSILLSCCSSLADN